MTTVRTQWIWRCCMLTATSGAHCRMNRKDILVCKILIFSGFLTISYLCSRFLKYIHSLSSIKVEKCFWSGKIHPTAAPAPFILQTPLDSPMCTSWDWSPEYLMSELVFPLFQFPVPQFLTKVQSKSFFTYNIFGFYLEQQERGCYGEKMTNGSTTNTVIHHFKQK